MDGKLTTDEFSKYQNTIFTLSADDVDPIRTTLVEITRLGAAPSAGEEGRQAFSIVLRGPADAYLPQQIYRLEHDQMGKLELFLVPIGEDREGMLFEAVFT